MRSSIQPLWCENNRLKCLRARRSLMVRGIIMVVVLPVRKAILAPLVGVELAPCLRPVEEVVRQFRQKIFIRGLTSDPTGRAFFDSVRVRLWRLLRPGSSRIPSSVFAHYPRHVVTFRLELRGAWAEIYRIVRWACGGVVLLIATFDVVGLDLFFRLRDRVDVIQIAGVARQEGENLGVELGYTLHHRHVAALVYKADLGPFHALGPYPYRLRIDYLILFPGDDEKGDLYDPGLPGEPAAGDLVPGDTQGLGDGGWRGAAGVIHHLFCEVVGVGDEGPYPEAADGTCHAPQGVEDGTDDGHGDEPQHGRKVDLVLVGRSSDDDEASDDVGMIGRELYGHGPAEVVADNAGVGQAEVGAESVEKPASVSYPVSGEWLVRLPKTTQVERIHGEALRQPPSELLPDTRRGQPSMYEYYRGPRADDIITDPDPFEFQVLRITGALYLPGVTPEHDGGCEDRSNHNEHDYQCDAHGGHDSAKTRQQDTGKTRPTRPASAWSDLYLHRPQEPRIGTAEPDLKWLGTSHSRSADTFAPLVAVEAFQLRAKEGTIVETCVAVDAEEHLLRTARVQVVIKHKVEELSVLFADLIHELRKRDAARDQTLARFVGIQLSQTTVGVPHDEPGGDVPQSHSLLHHQDGPFLAPGGVVPRFLDTP